MQEFIQNNQGKYSALIVHGLNNPSKIMEDLVLLFQRNQTNTYNVRLTGHKNDLEAYKTITMEQWLLDLEEGYKKLVELGRPIIFCGFSLGALLGLKYLLKPSIKFERLFLFAPAISTHFFTHFIQGTKVLGREHLLPSAIRDDYRANDFNSVAAYLELFRTQKLFLKDAQKVRLDIPTHVYIDPKDHLVSIKGIRKFIKKHKLNMQWKVHEVESKLTFNHINIDQASLGDIQWLELERNIQAELSSIT